MRKFLLSLVGALAMAIALPAQASVTVVDYLLSPGGTMSLNLDSDTGQYTLHSLSYAPFIPSHFDESDSTLDGADSFYRLYGNPRGANLDVTPGAEDFYFTFDPNLSTQIVDIFYYHGVGLPQPPYDLTIYRLSPGVPEPATWAMMLLGFGAIGLSHRRLAGQRGIASNNVPAVDERSAHAHNSQRNSRAF